MPDFLAAEEIDTLAKALIKPRPDMRCDVVVIGAGPTGLACAIEVQRLGLKAIVLDKGCLVNSLFHYPANMVFFTTPELLEIGEIPFTTAQQKPTREECAADRTRSNIPQQALVLMNDPTYVEAARVFAARILREGSADTATRAGYHGNLAA